MKGIVMLISERRSLFRFLTIYLSSTLLLFLLATVILYNYQKHNILESLKLAQNKQYSSCNYN
jgi:two-component system OmpR family sensor kinase